MISLRYLQDNLSGLGVESLLHLSIAERNSSLEKGGHSVQDLSGISSRKDLSICQCYTKLNNLWRACQRFSILRYGLLLYLIALIAGSFFFLT